MIQLLVISVSKLIFNCLEIIFVFGLSNPRIHHFLLEKLSLEFGDLAFQVQALPIHLNNLLVLFKYFRLLLLVLESLGFTLFAVYCTQVVIDRLPLSCISSFACRSLNIPNGFRVIIFVLISNVLQLLGAPLHLLLPIFTVITLKLLFPQFLVLYCLTVSS